MGFLKQLIISKPVLNKLKKITEVKQFVEIIKIYYPGLEISDYKLEEIEDELIHTYIKLIGKIMFYSPKNLRLFLRTFLLKYEINNIKKLILGTILNMSSIEKYSLINELAEDYIGNTDFIKELIEINSLDEIQFYLGRTRYNRAIREGLLYFKNNNEIFVLESFLDQLYYETLNKELKQLARKEKVMISYYVKYITEIYNLNTIYRGLKNKIDKALLAQFIVKSYHFLNAENIETILNLDKIEKFVPRLNKIYKNIEELRGLFKPIKVDEKHIISKIEKYYIKDYFKKFQLKIDNIEYWTIFKIIEILIKKDKEIRFKILPIAVKIIHEKYGSLKSRVKSMGFIKEI
jgi:V/A-type H+-transporting ATPase subunit C